VLGRMLQSLTDDHVCEPNEHITVCQRLRHDEDEQLKNKLKL